MKVVSVVNYKGGVGKSTLAANIGAELASRGYRVLLIDLDPQSSLTFSFYRPKEWNDELKEKRTIKRWFDEFVQGFGDTELSDLVVTPPRVNATIASSTSRGKLDLIASHLGLINVDLHLAAQLIGMGPAAAKAKFIDVHGRLAAGLKSKSLAQYDLVLIDCPPNFNIVTKTAIVASPHLLVPSRADDLSTLGTAYLLDSVKALADDYNAYVRMPPRNRATREVNPQPLGVVFTMVEIWGGKPTATNRQYMSNIEDGLGLKSFSTYVRNNQRLFAGSTYNGIPLAVAERVQDEIAQELDALADEFLEKLGMDRRANDGQP